jgi:hypothetical protein
VRWATREEQAANKRGSSIDSLTSILLRQMWRRAGRRYGQKQALAAACGVSYATAHKIANGRLHVNAVDDVASRASVMATRPNTDGKAAPGVS